MEIGKKLKEAREEQGLTLADVQKRSKIRRKYLKALEEEEFDVLPGQVYVKVFLKGYAKQLGLDGQELVSEYKRWLDAQEARSRVQHVSGSRDNEEEEEEQGRGYKFTVIAIIIIIISLFLINHFIISDTANQEVEAPETAVQQTESGTTEAESSDSVQETDSPEIAGERESDQSAEGSEEATEDNDVNELELETPPAVVDQAGLEQDTEEAEQEEEPSAEETETESQEEAVEESREFTLVASEEVWLQLQVDGEVVYEGFMYEGDEMTFEGEETARLRLGNAGAITVNKDGETLGPFGDRGQVLTEEISLE